MNIEYYSDFKDKDELYVCHEVNSKASFDIFLKEFSPNKKGTSPRFFFRGVNEAKYKLYNSGQRAWLTYELNKFYTSYQDIIRIQITNVKKAQNGLLAKFYKNLGSKAYDLTLLSFLQHYGGATPFLDWTEDIHVALYFALDGLKQFSATGIDNYFSVYVIDNEIFPDWQDLIKQESKELKEKKEVEKIINNPFYFQKPFYLKWGVNTINLQNHPPFLIHINRENLNIINQRGLFVFNPCPELPLEQVIGCKKIKCYNIHKSLSEYIRDKLNTKKITEDFIYPQEEELAKLAFLNVRKQLR